MSSPTDRLAVVPTRRPWALWLSLPLVGAGVAAVLLLFVLPGRPEPPAEPAAPRSTAPPQPTQPTEPPRPTTVVWNFETDPVGATITIHEGPPAMLAALAPQLEGHVTPLRLVVPYDDQARLQVTVTRAGYRPSKRSLIPMNNENFIVELQPEAPPAVPRVVPATNTITSSPKKKPPKSPTHGSASPPDSKGEETELKDEPIFSPSAVKGGG